MNPTVKARLSAHVQKLLGEGRAVLASKFSTSGGNVIDLRGARVDSQVFHKWLTGCHNFAVQIGQPARIWIDAFGEVNQNYFGAAKRFFGKLEALKEAIDDDLLVKVDDLVFADAFGSLLEQANELLEKQFTLAAGVLGRAVLEEHLRKLCERHACLPPDRPTINDLNQALYKGGHLLKPAMQHVTAMASAGNHCAHNNQPELSAAEVRKFVDDVQQFLVMNPLP